MSSAIKIRAPCCRCRQTSARRIGVHRVPGGGTRLLSRASPPGDNTTVVKADCPYQLATVKLRRLLRDVREYDHDSVVSTTVGDFSAEAKLTLYTKLGSLVTVGAFAVCLLCGEDPFGGVRFSQESLSAGGLGAMYAFPLLVCSFMGRTEQARTWFPVLDQLHKTQSRLLAPFISGLTAVQLMIMITFLTVPGLCVLLPAVKSSLDVTLATMYAFGLESPAWSSVVNLAEDNSDQLAGILAMLVSAYYAAWVAMDRLSFKGPEWFAIRSAMQESEQMSRSAFLVSKTTGQRTRAAASAFQQVAGVWLLTRVKVAQLGFILTALHIAYLGLIWQETGDLSAPAIAALLHFMTEFQFSRSEAIAASKQARKA